MLVLSRRVDQSLVIGECTIITVASIGTDSIDVTVKTPLGFQVAGRATQETTVTLRHGEYTRIKRVFNLVPNPNWPIDREVQLTLVHLRDDKARLGVEAPLDVPVHRSEVWDALESGGLPPSRGG